MQISPGIGLWCRIWNVRSYIQSYMPKRL